jgi:hypothetical protein
MTKKLKGKPVVTVTVDGVIIKSKDWYIEPSEDGTTLHIRKKGTHGTIEVLASPALFRVVVLGDQKPPYEQWLGEVPYSDLEG